VPLTKHKPPLATRLKCLVRGHAWVKSKSHPGYQTCRRCRERRLMSEGEADLVPDAPSNRRRLS